MQFSVCLVFLVTVWQASAQAPGDEISRCVNQRGAYPPNTRMLMDTRNYEQLITGSSAVWQAMNVDGTGSGWASSFGGLCAAQPRSCDYRVGTPQENWFFTQYIRYINAAEVIVNITTNFQECRLASNPSCTKLYVDMYRYERNGADATAASTTTNYQLVQRIEQPGGFIGQQYAASFSFTPSGNTNGFYLGFRDNGTCVNILRLQVYYNALQPVVNPPVTCPEVGRPPQGSTVPVTCSCPGNSNATSSLQLTCYPNGTCTGNPSCQCKEGHQEITGGCRACSAGNYSSPSDPSSCLPCPPNTITSGVAVAVCPCVAGFFRAPQENASVGCTQPPTAVGNLTVVNRTNTSITIQWTTPTRIGRPDYYYNVEYSDPNDPSRYHQHNQRRITNTNTYNVTGLRPNTTYVIRVSVHNGVSGNDSANDDDRREEVVTNTEEGVPSAPPVIPGLCRVVVWGTPSQSNGVLTGYDLRFYDEGQERIVNKSNSSKEILHIVQDEDIPTIRERTFVQVRGKTGAGPGNWSEGVSLGCNSTGRGQGQGQGTSAEGLVPSWYIAVAAVATCLLTAIVAIIIVLIIMRVCKKNQKNYGMKKANGIYEVDNPAYGVKK